MAVTRAVERLALEGVLDVCLANASFQIRFDPDRIAPHVLLYPEGDGEPIGDEASLAPGIGPKRASRLCSSEGVLISTSLSNDDKKEGADSTAVRVGPSFCVGRAWFGWIAEDASPPDDGSPFCVGSLRVRGRFNLLSGGTESVGCS